MGCTASIPVHALEASEKLNIERKKEAWAEEGQAGNQDGLGGDAADAGEDESHYGDTSVSNVLQSSEASIPEDTNSDRSDDEPPKTTAIFQAPPPAARKKGSSLRQRLAKKDLSVQSGTSDGEMKVMDDSPIGSPLHAQFPDDVAVDDGDDDGEAEMPPTLEHLSSLPPREAVRESWKYLSSIFVGSPNLHSATSPNNAVYTGVSKLEQCAQNDLPPGLRAAGEEEEQRRQSLGVPDDNSPAVKQSPLANIPNSGDSTASGNGQGQTRPTLLRRPFSSGDLSSSDMFILRPQSRSVTPSSAASVTPSPIASGGSGGSERRLLSRRSSTTSFEQHSLLLEGLRDSANTSRERRLQSQQGGRRGRRMSITTPEGAVGDDVCYSQCVTRHVVRLFLAATFQDMREEREVAEKCIIPKLRRWCEERRLHLVLCDVRPGDVRGVDPASDLDKFKLGDSRMEQSEANIRAIVERASQLNACLRHAPNSQPLLLSFISEVYGWVPSSTAYLDELYALSTADRKGTSKSLQRRGSLKLDLSSSGVATHWSRLHHIPGFSTHAMEIVKGALQGINPNALFFMRTVFKNGSAPPDHQVMRDLVDVEEEVDSLRERANLQLATLKKNLWQRLPNQVFGYSARLRRNHKVAPSGLSGDVGGSDIGSVTRQVLQLQDVDRLVRKSIQFFQTAITRQFREHCSLPHLGLGVLCHTAVCGASTAISEGKSRENLREVQECIKTSKQKVIEALQLRFDHPSSSDGSDDNTESKVRSGGVGTGDEAKRGKLIVLSGTPGVGKSAVLGEVVQELQAVMPTSDDLKTVQVSCSAQLTSLPQLLVAILRGLSPNPLFFPSPSEVFDVRQLAGMLPHAFAQATRSDAFSDVSFGPDGELWGLRSTPRQIVLVINDIDGLVENEAHNDGGDQSHKAEGKSPEYPHILKESELPYHIRRDYSFASEASTYWWLPKQLPAGVRIVLSCDQKSLFRKNAKQQYPDAAVIQMAPALQAGPVIQGIFEQRRWKVAPSKAAQLAPISRGSRADSGYATPLWVQIASTLIDDLPGPRPLKTELEVLPDDVELLAEVLLEAWSSATKGLSDNILSLLVTANRGASSEEILDLVEDLSSTQWQSVQTSQHFQIMLKETSEGVFIVRHRVFADGMKRFYHPQRVESHQRWKGYWEEKARTQAKPDWYRISRELPHHLRQLGDATALAACLAKWPVFSSLYNEWDKYTYISSWQWVGFQLAPRMLLAGVKQSGAATPMQVAERCLRAVGFLESIRCDLHDPAYLTLVKQSLHQLNENGKYATHPVSGHVLMRLANSIKMSGEKEIGDASRLLREGLEVYNRCGFNLASKNMESEPISVSVSLARACLANNQHDKAEELIAYVSEQYERCGGVLQASYADLMDLQCQVLMAKRDYSGAEVAAQSSLKIRLAIFGDQRVLAPSLFNLARVHAIQCVDPATVEGEYKWALDQYQQEYRELQESHAGVFESGADGFATVLVLVEDSILPAYAELAKLYRTAGWWDRGVETLQKMCELITTLPFEEGKEGHLARLAATVLDTLVGVAKSIKRSHGDATSSLRQKQEALEHAIVDVVKNIDDLFAGLMHVMEERGKTSEYWKVEKIIIASVRTLKSASFLPQQVMAGMQQLRLPSHDLIIQERLKEALPDSPFRSPSGSPVVREGRGMWDGDRSHTMQLQSNDGDLRRKEASALRRAAELLLKESRVEEAVKEYKRAVACDEMIMKTQKEGDNSDDFGKTAESLVKSLMGLAAAHKVQNQLAEEFEVLKAIPKHIRQQDTAHMARVLRAIGVNRLNMDEVDWAERTLEEARRTDLTGDGGRLLTASIVKSLAGVKMKKGEWTAAHTLLDEALGIFGQEVGERSHEYGKCVEMIGDVFLKEGRQAFAVEKFRAAHDIFKEDVGPFHPTTTRVSLKLGEAFKLEGDVNSAIAIWKEALETMNQTEGQFTEDAALVLDSLAAAEQGRENHADAVDYLRKALEARQKAYGKSHPIVAESLRSLASALEKVFRSEEGLNLYRQAWIIIKSKMGEFHPLSLDTALRMAQAMIVTNQLSFAENMLEWCVEASKEGDNHKVAKTDTLERMKKRCRDLIDVGDMESAVKPDLCHEVGIPEFPARSSNNTTLPEPNAL